MEYSDIFCSLSINIYITIRDKRVKFNDGNLKFVRDSGEFEISEFEITGFYCMYTLLIPRAVHKFVQRWVLPL